MAHLLHSRKKLRLKSPRRENNEKLEKPRNKNEELAPGTLTQG